MWKYLRLVFPLVYSYFFIVLPNILFKRWTTIAYRYRQIRKAVKMIFPVLKIDLYVDHPEMMKTTEPYLIVSNHHGMIDPFLMIYLMEQPLRFISKKEVRRFPIFGDATASIDALFIDRKDVRSQIRKLQQMKASMAKHETRWVIYPEGTRNRQYSQPVLPFKAGSFKHAMETNTSILPMVAYGFHRPLHKKIHCKRYPVQIDFLAPITPAMYQGKTSQEVADMIRGMIQTRSDAMVKKDGELMADILTGKKRKLK
jgi:1-acyl-sn-glycerol-3-phosphate acyltransferase